MRTNAILVNLAIGAVALAAGAGLSHASPPKDSDGFHFSWSAGKGRLGVAIIEISPELRAHLGAPGDRGVLVNTVAADSPAARAGVRVGDVITTVDGKASTSAWQVIEAMSDRKKGDVVALALVRDRKPLTVRATLDEDAPPPMSLHGMGDGQWSFDRFFGKDRDGLEKRLEALERRLDQLDRKR